MRCGKYRSGWIRRDSLVDVFEVAVVLVVEDRNLGGQPVFEQGALDRRRDIRLLFIRLADAYFRPEFPVRARISQQHRSARDVATEQQTLGPTQNFYALQVEGIEDDPVSRAQEDAIDEYADGRVDRGDRAVDALAADREVLHTREGAHRF